MSRLLKTVHQAFSVKQFERPGLEESDILEIKEVFDLFDPDRTGYVSPKELKDAIASLGSEAKNQTIYKMVSNLDIDGKIELDFREFLDLMTARMSDKDSKEDVRKVFRLYDFENTGYITTDNLKKMAKELGEGLDSSELRRMIERADSDGDGKVSFEDFYDIMTSKSFSKESA